MAWKKRTYRKRRRAVGKRRYRPNRKPGAPARSLTSGKVYNFKRTALNLVKLEVATPGDGWSINTAGTEIYKTWVFSLQDSIPDYNEFTRLFAYWRIKGVRIQGWVSNTVSGSHQGPAFDSNSLIMYTDRNIGGIGLTEQQQYLDSQTKKTQLMTNTGKRPAVDVYLSANQATNVYNSTINADYTYTKPKWISTAESQTQHYTHSNLITRVDGLQFTSGFDNAQYLRLHYTIYFQCKKVQ